DTTPATANFFIMRLSLRDLGLLMTWPAIYLPARRNAAPLINVVNPIFACSRASGNPGPNAPTSIVAPGPRLRGDERDKCSDPIASMFALGAAGERVVLLTQRQPDRRARQVERLTQPVDEVAPVVVGHRVGACAEQHEARWPALGLRQVVEL